MPRASSVVARRLLRVVAELAMAGALAAGCAGSAPSDTDGSEAAMPTNTSGSPGSAGQSLPGSATTPPGMSSTDLPTLKPPSGPPKTPTDLVPTDWIVGRVTAGGTGPCYGLETDDGKLYALHGGGGVQLTKGSTIRVLGKKPAVAVSCGPGEVLEIVKVEIIR